MVQDQPCRYSIEPLVVKRQALRRRQPVAYLIRSRPLATQPQVLCLFQHGGTDINADHCFGAILHQCER